MEKISVSGVELQLLPEKAIYVERLKALLISDVHLGKSETFQSLGFPVSNQVNRTTLDRLQKLCDRFQPENLFILGDLFHSKFALVDEVIDGWFSFVSHACTDVKLIVGNHDRALIPTLKKLSISYFTDGIQIENMILSHEPQPQKSFLNICGHVHPCVRIKTRLDNLRLSCFYLDFTQNLLILPSFGEFTGGFDVALKPYSTAYVVTDDSVIPFEGY
ncbi:MAG: ligase-associated DNA damage response endonuclease PdeM [Leptolyngbyaceae cyanobacterium HOT.MB2.61]|jgi:DNA ligase-associated metallophosphoesterase|nr:ligase-associated DNA damage response endonuclease PdeM [Leptolyngbyaceae cyanobacterium HOT.MB2.61]